MWIIQETKKVALWNKRHFEEKNEECAACSKYPVLIFVEKIYKKQHLESSGKPVLYIGRKVLKGESTERWSSWEANGFSASQEINRILWNPKVNKIWQISYNVRMFISLLRGFKIPLSYSLNDTFSSWWRVVNTKHNKNYLNFGKDLLK
jgi:hypothetical protein